jgi:hypothetical protein
MTVSDFAVFVAPSTWPRGPADPWKRPTRCRLQNGSSNPGSLTTHTLPIETLLCGVQCHFASFLPPFCFRAMILVEALMASNRKESYKP